GAEGEAVLAERDAPGRPLSGEELVLEREPFAVTAREVVPLEDRSLREELGQRREPEGPRRIRPLRRRLDDEDVRVSVDDEARQAVPLRVNDPVTVGPGRHE